MRNIFRPFRFGATCLVALLIVGGSTWQARAADDISPTQSTIAEKQNAELAESHRQLREQLRAAEQAILTNRLEAEAAANARTAAITEKLDTLRLTMVNERERLRLEAERVAYERLQQQAAAQAMTQTILQVVIAFGGAGLLALITMTVLQWRGNRRLAEYTAQMHFQPLPEPKALLPGAAGAPGGESVALANQRLVSMLDRMERRVLELEQTVTVPAPSPTDDLDNLRKAAPDLIGTAEQIAVLLDHGQSFLNAKRPAQALACFEEILGIDANHAEALMKKGSALERLQQNNEALEYYDRAIEADRNLALAYISKGGLCVRLERFDEALACYEQAMQAGKNGNPGGIARVSVSADWPAQR